ncbi:hypothetical protein Saro_3980 (plasmid) [Novosphingobium aromaticivorans DSM 12444]|uniref:Uncharacterized protein n=2 Tax=Novosphingobium aromaticivorans TaxID=48935 RepID=A4XE61_NOVAD|nr:unknown [Novosphingobium aromaticivorans]ABP64222.1 hypothetical protein Saro_3980 [Novosphingobium aromaticivorans DSM 12444]
MRVQIKRSRGIEPRLRWPFARPVSACPKAFLGFVQTELCESGEEAFDPLERRLAENRFLHQFNACRPLAVTQFRLARFQRLTLLRDRCSFRFETSFPGHDCTSWVGAETSRARGSSSWPAWQAPCPVSPRSDLQTACNPAAQATVGRP